MEISQELLLAIIGLIAAAAITITVVVRNHKRITKTTIKQKGNNPQAYVNSKVNNSKKVEK